MTHLAILIGTGLALAAGAIVRITRRLPHKRDWYDTES